MSANVGYATVSIIPSAKGFQAALNKQIGPAVGASAATHGKTAGNRFKGAMLAPLAALGPAMAGVMGAAAVGGFMKGAIEQASDLSEVGTALKQVFGDGLSTVNAFGDTGAKALGMTKLQALQAAQTFGVYGKAAGLSGKENAKFSTTLASLGTDLASFYNTSPEEAIEALGSGLRGEAEPLRKYGILLDDATLRQQALKMGLIKSTKEALSPQNKVLAAQAAIMKQSKVAQGDFARTSGGLANQQRILSAQWGDLKGKIGGAFLPAVLGAVKGLNGLFDSLSVVSDGAKVFWGAFTGKGADAEVGGLTNRLIDFGAQARYAFDAISNAVTPLLPKIKSIATTALAVFRGQVIPTVLTLAKSFITNLIPVIKNLATLFVTRMVPAAVAVAKYFVANLLPIIVRVYNIIATQVIPVIGSLARWFTGTLLPAVFSIAQSIGTSLKPVLDTIFEVISSKVIPAVLLIITKFREWQPAIQKVIGVVVQVIGWVLKFAAAILGKVLPPLIRFAGFLIVNIVKANLAIIGVIGKSIAKVFEFGKSVVGAVGKIGEFVTGAKRKFGEALTFIGGLPGKALKALGNLGKTLLGAGGDLIAGFAQGIRNGAGNIISAIKEAITDKLPKFVKDALKIKSPSRVFMKIGGYTAEGMALGISKSAHLVTKAADGLVHVPTPAGARGAGVAGGAGRSIAQTNHFYGITDAEEAAAASVNRLTLKARLP